MKIKTQSTWLLAIAFTAISSISAQAVVQLAINGDFETGDATGWASFPTANSTFVVEGPGASGSFAGTVSNLAQGSSAVIKQSNLGVGLLTQASPSRSLSIFSKIAGRVAWFSPNCSPKLQGAGLANPNSLGARLFSEDRLSHPVHSRRLLDPTSPEASPFSLPSRRERSPEAPLADGSTTYQSQ